MQRFDLFCQSIKTHAQQVGPPDTHDGSVLHIIAFRRLHCLTQDDRDMAMRSERHEQATRHGAHTTVYTAVCTSARAQQGKRTCVASCISTGSADTAARSRTAATHFSVLHGPGSCTRYRAQDPPERLLGGIHGLCQIHRWYCALFLLLDVRQTHHAMF